MYFVVRRTFVRTSIVRDKLLFLSATAQQASRHFTTYLYIIHILTQEYAYVYVRIFPNLPSYPSDTIVEKTRRHADSKSFGRMDGCYLGNVPLHFYVSDEISEKQYRSCGEKLRRPRGKRGAYAHLRRDKKRGPSIPRGIYRSK